ncbi:MAG: O-antigen ligase family protein [Anaerolineaceae bacterium]|nr:MAG: O-antigen ligase family protein [Anaerolineaceae bacterium]
MRRLARIVINWEWLFLLLLLPILLFPTGWRGLVLLIIPLLWILRKFAIGHFVPPTPFDTTVLVMMATILISLAAVFDINLSFPKIAGLILGIAYFYGGVQHARQNHEGEYHLLSLIFIAGTGMALVGFLSIISITSFADIAAVPSTALSNILGRTVNPNELAGVLGWLLPLLLASTIGFWRPMWRSGHWWPRLLHLILVAMLLFNAVVLLATRSRGGVLSICVALIVMLAVRFRWGRWLLLVIVTASIALGFYLDLGAFLLGDTQTAADLGLQGRLEIWSRALYGLADFPLTGMSMNGFRQIVHVLYPLFTIALDFDLGHAHNHLLQAGLDLGIIGLIAYLGIWILSLTLLWIGWRNSRRHSDRVLIVGLSGSLTAGWVFGILDAIALGARPGFLWWLLLALLVTVFDSVRRLQSQGNAR